MEDVPACAVVGAGRVDALVLAARGVLGALVDVLAVGLDGGLRVPLVAHALVRAHQVLARTVTAYACTQTLPFLSTLFYFVNMVAKRFMYFLPSYGIGESPKIPSKTTPRNRLFHLLP